MPLAEHCQQVPEQYWRSMQMGPGCCLCLLLPAGVALACSFLAATLPPAPAAGVAGSTTVCTHDTSPALPPFASCT